MGPHAGPKVTSSRTQLRKLSLDDALLFSRVGAGWPTHKTPPGRASGGWSGGRARGGAAAFASPELTEERNTRTANPPTGAARGESCRATSLLGKGLDRAGARTYIPRHAQHQSNTARPRLGMMLPPPQDQSLYGTVFRKRVGVGPDAAQRRCRHWGLGCPTHARRPPRRPPECYAPHTPFHVALHADDRIERLGHSSSFTAIPDQHSLGTY